VVAAVALFLLLPVLSGVAEMEFGYQAQAAPTFHAGGPDQFGYTFRDSNEPGGPSYTWEEISTTGAQVQGWTSYDDGYAGPIPIGFTFNYYGVDYTELFVGTNGFVSFGQGFGAIPGGALPQTYEPNNDIALFGGDMYLNSYGADSVVSYQTLSNPTRFVVQFTNLYYCCWQNTPRTFQVILYPKGDIQAQYKLLNSTDSTYVGIENVNGTDGLSYGATLADNLAIRYYYPSGVFLTPPEQTRFGEPGAVVTHTVQLTNRIGSADSFDLSVQPGSAWPTTLSLAQTGVLGDGESVSFTAQVAIPVDAAVGATDQAIILATSVTTPTISDTATLSTYATSGETAYVTLSQSNLIALVDTSLHSVLGTIDVGAAGCVFPWRATITPDGNQAYVSCYNSGNVVVIDTGDNSIVTTVGGIPSADGSAFTRNSEYALVGSRWNSQVTVIHTKSYATTAIPTSGSPRSIAVHPYLNRAYVTVANGTILVIDTATMSTVTSIPVFSNPWDVAVSIDGRWVYTSDRNGSGLAVIDAFSNTLHTTLTSLGTLTGLDVSPDGATIYAAALGNGVKVIDSATLQVITTIYTAGTAWELAATCDGSEVWLGNSSNTVLVIDAATNQQTLSIDMPGSQTKEIAICPQHAVQGVFLAPPSQVNNGAPGEMVTHQITLVNATGDTDSFALSLNGFSWPAALSSNLVGPLADGQIATVEVSVTIPPGSTWYSSDTGQVTAIGVGNPSFSSSAALTTVADAPPVIGTAPSALSSIQPVNQTTDQTLVISNGNGVTLTVQISDMDLTPEMVQTMPLDLPRADDLFPGSTSGAGDVHPAQPTPVASGHVPRALAHNLDPSTQIFVGSVYTTTLDNEDNALTGNPDYDMDTSVCNGYSIAPIEFNIFVDRVAGLLGNILTVRAYDVDIPQEVDAVHLNGVYLGDLTGGDELWSETSFAIPPGLIVMGANLVQISPNSGWCVHVDWGELFVAARPADWLHQNPDAATVATNSSQDIVVTFDSTGLQPGEYAGAIVLQSNDPVQPYLQVPVDMTAEPTADMGRVAGAISDAWTGLPLTASVELAGVHTMTASPTYEIWATAGAYSLIVSAPDYVSVTLPVNITAGSVTLQDVSLEPALGRLEWSPQSVEAGIDPGGTVTSTLVVSNTGPVPMDMALFEINLSFIDSAPTPQDLSGKRILYDRAHGQPSSDEYSTLVADAVAAGAVVVENWYFPVDELVLEGYDILWTNCCGGMTWGLSELLAVNNWLREGGAVLVQGENSPSTAGPASIFGIYYASANCSSGWTNNITPHPISVGVNNVSVDWTCWRLSPSTGSDIVVYDTAGQPHVVAKAYNGGKMVALASEDLSNWIIADADNRLLGNNILGWLARPAYSDVPWLEATPVSGVVPGHSALPVTLAFDATNLPSGLYHARLAIEHNAPNQPFPAEVPVALTVYVPTAVALNDLSTTQPGPAMPVSLPLAALPAAAVVALSLTSWRSRKR
jgi:YVTN family beta-propeller protein